MSAIIKRYNELVETYEEAFREVIEVIRKFNEIKISKCEKTIVLSKPNRVERIKLYNVFAQKLFKSVSVENVCNTLSENSFFLQKKIECLAKVRKEKIDEGVLIELGENLSQGACIGCLAGGGVGTAVGGGIGSLPGLGIGFGIGVAVGALGGGILGFSRYLYIRSQIEGVAKENFQKWLNEPAQAKIILKYIYTEFATQIFEENSKYVNIPKCKIFNKPCTGDPVKIENGYLDRAQLIKLEAQEGKAYAAGLLLNQLTKGEIENLCVTIISEHLNNNSDLKEIVNLTKKECEELRSKNLDLSTEVKKSVIKKFITFEKHLTIDKNKKEEIRKILTQVITEEFKELGGCIGLSSNEAGKDLEILPFDVLSNFSKYYLNERFDVEQTLYYSRYYQRA